jgi:hypothetical protein
MDRLRQLVGHEKSLKEVTQTLHLSADSLGSAAVGAMHVTCADESERECADAFQHGFVRYMLPPLKVDSASTFRLANLGGRYEWGSVRIAESHFATREAGDRSKLLVVKINAHVAIEDDPSHQTGSSKMPETRPFTLGTWKRYGSESACCGALHALLQGHDEPFTEELREAFGSEGHDRVAALLDESRVDPTYRPLYAAMVSARLQARKVVLDIQDYSPVTPTFFLVLACVTINRHRPDTEILSGLYTVDGRDGGRDATYFGLGDDPADYETRMGSRDRFIVTDEHVGSERKGRDHRALVREQLRTQTTRQIADVQDDRLERIRQDVSQNKHHHHHHAKSLLRVALPVLAEVAPIPAAVLMFADGAVGIHHAFRVHRLAREMEGTAEARQMLDEIEGKIDTLDGDHAAALLEMLMNEYRR